MTPREIDQLAEALAAKLDRLTLVPLLIPGAMTMLARYEVRSDGLLIELECNGDILGRVLMGVRK